MLVSGVSEVIQVCIYTYLLFFKLFPYLGCYGILSSVSCAIHSWLSVLNTSVICQYQTPILSLRSLLPALVTTSSFSKPVSLFQYLILTCIQEPKEVIQRPLEKSSFFSTTFSFLFPLFWWFWSQFLLHYQKKEGHGIGEPFFCGEGRVMCLPLWSPIWPWYI